MVIEGPIHPLATKHNSSGANGISSGDLFRYDLDGKIGRLDEAFHDGDALVTWEDGSHGEVKWNRISAYRPNQPEINYDSR